MAGKKRAIISPDGRECILRWALKKYPEMKRTPLAEKLQAKFRHEGWAVPKLEVLERLISEYRNHPPEDKPWSLASLNDDPIPPEAIPAVLKLLDLRIQKGGWLTIREAKWAVRLSATLEGNELNAAVRDYAWYEAIHPLISKPGQPFETFLLDQTILLKRKIISLPPKQKRKTDPLKAIKIFSKHSVEKDKQKE